MPTYATSRSVLRTLLIAAAALLAGVALDAQSRPRIDVMDVLEGVEDRYNHVKTLKSTFTQVYTAGGRNRGRESGTLYLEKPGRMRWDYTKPKGKLFVTDSDYSYVYYPDDRLAQRQKIKESADIRIPLAFLLGRLDFRKDFHRFLSHPEGEDVRITAIPTNEKLLFTEIEMLIAPDSSLKEVKITGQDYSVMDFTFTDEKIGLPLKNSLFTLYAPRRRRVRRHGRIARSIPSKRRHTQYNLLASAIRRHRTARR